MYLHHYKLKKQPFSISPDDQFLWLSEKHSEALATLKYGIMENKGFLLLTGDVGTGKTVLLNRLIGEIEGTAIVASLTDPRLDIQDFFYLLAAEFNMKMEFSSKGEFLIQFKQFLLRAESEKQKPLLIIDEAQRLSHELLEQIRLLSNIELNHKKLLNIFFVGQSEFNEMLLEERNRAVRQRITLRYNIEPLTENEIHHYIRHRLKIAGVTNEIFTAEANREIYAFTSGYPRLINVICDHALLSGYASNLKLIDGEVIKECNKELNIQFSLGSAYVKTAKNQIFTDTLPLPNEPYKFMADTRIGLIVSMMFIILLLTTGAYFLTNKPVNNNYSKPVNEIKSQEYNETLYQKSNIDHEAGKLVDEENTVQQVKKAYFTGKEDENKIPLQQFEMNLQNHAVAAEILTHTQKTANAGNSQIIEPSRKKLSSPLNKKKIIIYFKHNSNEILIHDLATIDNVVSLISDHPTLKVLIEGFTDSHGNYNYNKQLSKSRAEVVKNYFVAKGVATDRIEIYGRGPNNPINSNDTIEGRKQNRRVEIKLIAGKAS